MSRDLASSHSLLRLLAIRRSLRVSWILLSLSSSLSAAVKARASAINCLSIWGISSSSSAGRFRLGASSDGWTLWKGSSENSSASFCSEPCFAHSRILMLFSRVRSCWSVIWKELFIRSLPFWSLLFRGFQENLERGSRRPDRFSRIFISPILNGMLKMFYQYSFYLRHDSGFETYLRMRKKEIINSSWI